MKNSNSKNNFSLNLTIALLFSVMGLQNIKAQDTAKTDSQHKIYHCWVWNDTLSYTVSKGFIESVTDSGIFFSQSVKGNSYLTTNRTITFIRASSIEKIKVRRNGNVGKGLLLGAGMGFFIGGALGYAGVPDYGIFGSLPPSTNAAVGGFVFLIPGIIIGGLVGAFRFEIPIHKNERQFKHYWKQLAVYSISK